MCIEVIHEIFPGAEVEWERTDRVRTPMMTVEEVLSGDEILTFIQKDMSDQYYGPGVDELRNKLRELKESKK